MEKNNITTPLKNVNGVGSQLIKHFISVGIYNTYQLVNYIPSGYENMLESDIDLARHNDVITIVGTLNSEISVTTLRKILKIEFTLTIKLYQIDIIMFRPTDFMSGNFNLGDQILVKGKFNLYASKIEAVIVKKYNVSHSLIIPKYKIEGIMDTIIQKIVKNIFDNKQVTILESIPQDFILKHHLLSKADSLEKIHLPKTNEDLENAYKRLKYEEALFLQLGIQTKRKRIYREPINYDINEVKKFIDIIPYELTKDQKEAVNDIFRDFKKDEISYRLIQGDVGSGKTIVSLIAAYGIITTNRQVAIMVPTEILATQHYNLIKKMFGKIITVELLTQKVKNKANIKERLLSGEINLIVGTQSLIQDDVEFNNLGLVIIDEQHRFGVNARTALEQKSKKADSIYLTATPIPRTLAISFFGNMDISSIKEKPGNRKNVQTFYFTDNQLKDVYKQMHKELELGNQAFVVVPAIFSDLKDENIETVEKKIKAEFNNEVFVIHGGLSSKEIEGQMQLFSETKSSILIATTMIEVGLDIKNASIMVIFAAENFGLSQLHQLRGRIGRNDQQAYCYVISKKDDVDRLSFFATHHDGFILSEFDLKERGPGEFIGLKQSGKLEYQYLNFNTDYNILIDTLEDAKDILRIPDLYTSNKYIQIRRYLENLRKEM